jgi:hypothetical protein
VREIYLAIALLTLASRVITVASNLHREYRYYKYRKNNVGKSTNKNHSRRNRFHHEDNEFYEETDYGFRDRF